MVSLEGEPLCLSYFFALDFVPFFFLPSSLPNPISFYFFFKCGQLHHVVHATLVRHTDIQLLRTAERRGALVVVSRDLVLEVLQVVRNVCRSVHRLRQIVLPVVVHHFVVERGVKEVQGAGVGANIRLDRLHRLLHSVRRLGRVVEEVTSAAVQVRLALRERRDTLHLGRLLVQREDVPEKAGVLGRQRHEVRQHLLALFDRVNASAFRLQVRHNPVQRVAPLGLCAEGVVGGQHDKCVQRPVLDSVVREDDARPAQHLVQLDHVAAVRRLPVAALRVVLCVVHVHVDVAGGRREQGEQVVLLEVQPRPVLPRLRRELRVAQHACVHLRHLRVDHLAHVARVVATHAHGSLRFFSRELPGLEVVAVPVVAALLTVTLQQLGVGVEQVRRVLLVLPLQVRVLLFLGDALGVEGVDVTLLQDRLAQRVVHLARGEEGAGVGANGVAAPPGRASTLSRTRNKTLLPSFTHLVLTTLQHSPGLLQHLERLSSATALD
eukprot:Rhum_TRINITY_DN18747_c0_g1::Rhum_TRINITY_DN18747_c0_g1_i1::g.168312::m.168312